MSDPTATQAQIETVEYILPSYWATALINCDRSGLHPDDEKWLDKFLIENLDLYCVDMRDDVGFRAHNEAPGDAGLLGAECATFIFHAI